MLSLVWALSDLSEHFTIATLNQYLVHAMVTLYMYAVITDIVLCALKTYNALLKFKPGTRSNWLDVGLDYR